MRPHCICWHRCTVTDRVLIDSTCAPYAHSPVTPGLRALTVQSNFTCALGVLNSSTHSQSTYYQFRCAFHATLTLLTASLHSFCSLTHSFCSSALNADLKGSSASAAQLTTCEDLCSDLSADLEQLDHVLYTGPQMELKLPELQEIASSLEKSILSCNGAYVSESISPPSKPARTWEAEELAAQLASPRWSRTWPSFADVERQDLVPNSATSAPLLSSPSTPRWSLEAQVCLLLTILLAT